MKHRAIILSHPSSICSIPHTLNTCGTHPHKQTMPGLNMVVPPAVVQNALSACFSPARFMLQPTCYQQSSSGDNLGHCVHLCSALSSSHLCHPWVQTCSSQILTAHPVLLSENVWRVMLLNTDEISGGAKSPHYTLPTFWHFTNLNC